jgi:hypothetical protein
MMAVSIFTAKSQNGKGSGLQLKVGTINYITTDAKRVFGNGFLIGGAYSFKLNDKSRLQANGHLGFNPFATSYIGTGTTNSGFGQAQLTFGYRRYFGDFFANASVGYLKGQAFVSSIASPVSQIFGISTGAGYNIKLNSRKSIEIFVDFNNFGPSFSYKNMSIGVAYNMDGKGN